MPAVGVIGFLAVAFLPGAWITFGLPLRGLSFWSRLLAGVVLAPVVADLQFYLLRALGVPFELTAILLVAVNLPVLYLIVKRTHAWPRLDARVVAAWLLALALPMAFLAVRFHDLQIRAYYGHGWMHADIIYMLANGALRPEEPQLAGVLLAYPWAGHVYQAILSYLLGTSPVSNYVWTNVVWLLCVYGLVAAVAAELGGNRFSQISTVIWLSFGVNVLGYVLWETLPRDFAAQYPIWGDPRYTTWLRKFFPFEQMVFGLGIFAALALFLVRTWERGLTRDLAIMIGVLVCGIGVMYPILYPAAGAIVGAKAVALLVDRNSPSWPTRYRDILVLASVVVIAGLVTLGYVSFVTVERSGSGMVLLSSVYRMKVKAASSVVALLLFLAGLALSFRSLWLRERSALIVLTLGALGSTALYVMFLLPGVTNEYKYIFTAAICLAPFPALALQSPLQRLGRWALPAFAAVAVLLAAPAAHKIRTQWPRIPENPPVVDVRSFDLRLDKSERFAAVCDVIREQTRSNTILVVEKSDFEFPTVTRRQMYVPFKDQFVPGVGLNSRHLLKNVKGYDEDLLESRRTTVGRFLFGDQADRESALATLLELNRPLAMILEEQPHRDLIDWLSNETTATLLYRDAGLMLWLIQPQDVQAAEPSRS